MLDFILSICTVPKAMKPMKALKKVKKAAAAPAPEMKKAAKKEHILF